MFMTGYINYGSVEQALMHHSDFTAYVVLEKHKDGTASVVFLQHDPVQKGQVEYKGYQE